MPSRISVLIRIAWNVAVTAAGILTISELSSSLTVNSIWAALIAALLIGALNAVVAPALIYLTLPLSVATLGLAAIVINGAMVALALAISPGIEINDVASGIVIAIGLTILNVAVAAITAVDDDYWFENRMRRRAAKSSHHERGEHGTVFIQIDGLAHGVVARAMRNGNAPNLFRMVHRGDYDLRRWQTDWSSQTGAGQAGILLGSNENMPAFRWIDKRTRRRYVSNHRDDAGIIESRQSESSTGLLADDGASFGNLFSGGATRGLMTISAVGKRKEGGFGSGYGQYFSQPYNATRTAVRFVANVLRELHNARTDERREIEPRIHRGFSFAFARAFTSTVMADVCVTGVLEQMALGRSRIYIDLLSYDEIAHHCGVERADALLALRDIDRQIGRIVRFGESTGRRYDVVILSDHGQSAGVPFSHEFGESLADVVARSTQASTRLDEVHDEATSFVHPSHQGEKPPVDHDIEVLCSGNLGLVYLMESPNRLTAQEISQKWPALIKDLVSHPGIGFVLVGSENGDGLVIGNGGAVNITTGEVEGIDPLEKFGPLAHERVRRTHQFRFTADLMVNADWNSVVDLTYPFETFVGSHGGMGGEQSEGFVIIHRDAQFPNDVVGAEQLHALFSEYANSVSRTRV